MKIGVLSRCGDVFSTRSLLETGRELDLEMCLLPILETRLGIGPGLTLARWPAFDAAERPLDSRPPDSAAEDSAAADSGIDSSQLDFVIPRVGGYLPELAWSACETLERDGVTLLNPTAALVRARHKFHSLGALARAGVSVPRTVLVQDLRQIDGALDDIWGGSGAGTEMVVIKPVYGGQGRGVMLAQGRASAFSIVEGLLYLDQIVVLQEYFAGAREVRALVLGEEVLGAVERTAPEGAFRANLHCGGSVEPIQLDENLSRRAVAAARALGLRFAGIDFLHHEGDWRVLEGNASPGWEGFEAATGIAVARVLLEWLVRTHAGTLPQGEGE